PNLPLCKISTRSERSHFARSGRQHKLLTVVSRKRAASNHFNFGLVRKIVSFLAQQSHFSGVASLWIRLALSLVYLPAILRGSQGKLAYPTCRALQMIPWMRIWA